MSRERVEKVLDGYRLFNEGKLDQALEVFPDDVEWVVLEMFPDPGPYHGKEGVRRFWDTWQETFQEFQIEILEVHDLEDNVVAITRVRGTGRDSGAEVHSPVFPTVWTWHDDEIVRMEMFTDSDAASEAIGKDWR